MAADIASVVGVPAAWIGGTPKVPPPAAAQPLVVLDQISYAYDGDSEPVLRDVSLAVCPGEFVLLLGPSGCGKSTLLQILNGTIPHTLKGHLEGAATVCGSDVATTRVASFSTRVGMVFQDPDGQIINTRVRDEVAFCLENLCRPPAEIASRQAEALALVGLADAGDRSVFELSGGQKQRVSIAAVLAAQPTLLVLDEPTANLDPVGMAEVFSVLERLNRDAGTTIILVEHRVDELADKVSRVVMMDHGAIVFDGTPRAAFARRRHIGGTDGAARPVGVWSPQVSEFALDLAAALNLSIGSAGVPLHVSEALSFCERIAERPAGCVAPPTTRPPGASDASAPLVDIRALRFGYERDAPVLNGIDLTLPENAIVALLGRNGSGKTTLARVLIGINAPPRGSVFLRGRDAAGLNPLQIAADVGYVFQNPDHQFVTDTVADEIGYGLRIRDYSEEAIAQRVAEVLDIVDLARYRDRSPFSLSLGERRRLSVATMLVLEPKLLILDEPTIGQDYDRAQQLMALMARLRKRYRTAVLMITHDVRLVAEWADRALVLSDGQLVFDGAPQELFADTALSATCGLLPPPILTVSRALDAAHPEWSVPSTLSVAELVAHLSAVGGGEPQ